MENGLFSNIETLHVDQKAGKVTKVTQDRQKIIYLGGKQYLMTGSAVVVDIPTDANYIMIYAEDDDIRIGINTVANSTSPLMSLGGITPQIMRIDNLNSLSLWGTSGDHASVNFMRRE